MNDECSCDDWAALGALRAARAGRTAEMSSEVSDIQAVEMHIKAVRALHVEYSRYSACEDNRPVCLECGHGWPCRTIRILDAVAVDADASPEEQR
jgi:hypothetical protein